MLQSVDTDDDERGKELRSEPRSAVSLVAIVRRKGRPDVQAQVRNLSSGGMMAQCLADFGRGDPIEVDLPGIGAVGGKIAWTANDRIGVAFERAVDPTLGEQPTGARIQSIFARRAAAN